MTQGLPRKLRFAFLMQVAMASIVILAGTWVAMTVAKEQIARYALQEEADYFWSRRALDPARDPPDESRLRGYALAAGDSIVQQFLGHGIAARLSARLGEGVVNGLLTARIGIAAIEVCRPLPFVTGRPPRRSDVMAELARLGGKNGKVATEEPT